MGKLKGKALGLLITLNLLQINYTYGQIEYFTKAISKTSEKIVEYSFDDVQNGQYFIPVGNIGSKKVYQFEGETGDLKLYVYSEDDKNFVEIFKNLRLKGNNLYDFCIKDSLIFYRKMFFESIEDYGYSQLKIQYGQTIVLLDSIYNSDKKIHSSFSSDGKYLLVNTLNTLSDYYNPLQDNNIVVYNLEEIKKGKVTKQFLPCLHCSKSYFIIDKLFFNKVNEKDAYDGFENADIYMAPWGSIKDSIKIASTSRILSISPDGKYILATRFFDTQQEYMCGY